MTVTGQTGFVGKWDISMDITVLCSDKNHPVMKSLRKWVDEVKSRNYNAALVSDTEDLRSGDILFLVSCNQVIAESIRKNFKVVLVLHASDLPKGRGWSPHVWSILSGATHITVSLLEASDPVDSGDIWLKTDFVLEGHELLPEINEKLFMAETNLMTRAITEFNEIKPVRQKGDPGPYNKRRTPADSRLDPDKTIAEQFDLLRVADPERYPAFFEYRGSRYVVKLEKAENHDR